MDDWSAAENQVILLEYFSMLEQELAGQSYVKARHNQRVREQTGRSKGSVEFKFQNISAAMRDLHAPWIEGYKPARNYQATLADSVAAYLAGHSSLLDLMRQSVENSAAPRIDFAWRVVDPPVDLAFGHSKPQVLHTDFVMLEAANRSLGASGEKLILERERSTLRAAGREDLASRVDHVSVTQGDGLGYDIFSFDPDGRPRIVEVKTTRRGQGWPMLVSRNEVSVSRDLAAHYVLARVFEFSRPTVGLFELRGAIEDTCVLEPETWRALPRAS